MKRVNAIFLILCLALLCSSLVPQARASEWDKKTYITFNQPIELPSGMVLQPGEYVFKLLDSPSNRNIVQIFNKDENHVFATILAIPNYRLQPTDKTKMSLYEMPSGQPQALRAWFYPADTFGQEFAYPKTRSVQIAAVTQTEVPALTAEDQSNLAQATPPAEASVAPKMEESKPAETPQVAQETAPQQQPATTTEKPSEEAERTLPASASDWPLVALLGLFSLGVAFTLRLLAKGLA